VPIRSFDQCHEPPEELLEETRTFAPEEEPDGG
jgi:hypothetical protein